MYCKNCGAELPENGAFCANCGAPRTEEAPNGFSEMPDMEFPAQEPIYGGDGLEAAEPARQPKRRGKRIAIAVIAAVLVVALAAIGTVYALVWSRPEWKLKTAAEKTAAALAEQFENAEEFNQMLENTQALAKRREYTVALSFRSRGTMGNFGGEIRLDCSTPQGFIAGQIGLGLLGADDSAALALYANNDELRFGLPGLLDDVYSVPAQGFGEAYLDWMDRLGIELTPEMRRAMRDFSLHIPEGSEDLMAEFRKEYADEIETFQKSLKLRQTDETIPDVDGLTVYSVTLDGDALERIFACYMEFLQERSSLPIHAEIDFNDLDVLLGVDRRRYLTAVHVMGRSDEMTFLLEGKDNPWESIRACRNGETALTGEITRERDGCALALTVEGETLELRLDDDSRELRASFEGEEVFTLDYDADDGGMGIRVDLTDEVVMEFRFMPLQEPNTLSGDPIDLFSLDQEDIQEIVEEIMENWQRSYRP